MSPTREKYPLSEVKIWKKTYSSVSTWFILQLLLFGFGMGIIASLDSISGPTAGLVYLAWIIGNIIFSLLVFGGYYLWQRWYFQTYYYDFGDDHLVIRKGTITPREITVPYPRIQDVYVDQDLFDRLFGLYDVHLSTATQTSGMEAHIDGVGKAAADGLRADLLRLIHAKQGGAKLSTGSVEMKVKSKATSRSSRKEITEVDYPIQKKWMYYTLLLRAFSSIIATLTGAVVYFSFFKNADLGLNVSLYALFLFGGTVFSTLLSAISLPLWVANFHYSLEEENITIWQGIISKSVRNIRYGVIQDVVVNQGLFDRLFGFSSLTIENAAQGGFAVSIPGLLEADAKTMKQLIQQKMQENPTTESQVGGL